MVTTQPVFTNAYGARREVRDGDAGVIASSAADQLRSGEGIYAPKASGFGNRPIQPTSFDCHEVSGRQTFANEIEQKSMFPVNRIRTEKSVSSMKLGREFRAGIFAWMAITSSRHTLTRDRVSMHGFTKCSPAGPVSSGPPGL